MAHHFANSINFGESQRGMPFPPRTATFDPGGFDTPVRVMLIAIRHDPHPPVFHGQHLLQRLQAMLATSGDQLEFNPQRLPARFASQIPAESFEETRLLLPPRVLPVLPLQSAQDEGDEQNALQPRLVQGDILTDSSGRLYEKFGRQVRPLQRVVSGPRGEILELAPTSERKPQSPATKHDEGQTPAARQTAPDQPAEPYRKLRPDHRRMRTPRNGDASQPFPTAARPERAGSQLNRQADRQPVRQQPLQPQTKPQTNEVLPAAGLKTAIPEEWIKNWELQLSRDEALYDMRIEAAANNTFIGSVRNLKRRIGNRQAFQKWQSLLCGKSLDEQLWGVRPPSGQFSHPQVREWAQRVLSQAGYDAGVMLPEWEIFWRRKGL